MRKYKLIKIFFKLKNKKKNNYYKKGLGTYLKVLL